MKGTSFVELRDAGDPVELAARYRDEGTDELVFLDITASWERRHLVHKMASAVAREINVPFTIGGGIRNEKDAKLVLRSGADKISLNTAAVEKPRLITRLAKDFGQQCVVVAIDAKRSILKKGECFEVYTYGARKATGLDAVKWAAKVEQLGAGELLVTSIDRDGTKLGYDIEMLRSISDSVNVPVIASGGCGELNDFYEALIKGGADAALAASVFHYGTFKIRQVKSYLRERGVAVRL